MQATGRLQFWLRDINVMCVPTNKMAVSLNIVDTGCASFAL